MEFGAVEIGLTLCLAVVVWWAISLFRKKPENDKPSFGSSTRKWDAAEWIACRALMELRAAW
jgi:hypothetical protein